MERLKRVIDAGLVLHRLGSRLLADSSIGWLAQYPSCRSGIIGIAGIVDPCPPISFRCSDDVHRMWCGDGNGMEHMVRERASGRFP